MFDFLNFKKDLETAKKYIKKFEETEEDSVTYTPITLQKSSAKKVPKYITTIQYYDGFSNYPKNMTVVTNDRLRKEEIYVKVLDSPIRIDAVLSEYEVIGDVTEITTRIVTTEVEERKKL